MLMSEAQYALRRYDEAAAYLPPGIRDRAARLLSDDKRCAEEFRLRAGRVPSVLLPEGEVSLGGSCVTQRDIETLVDIATGASAHTARESIRHGYITAKGGFRIGLCGTASVQDGGMTGFRELTSASLRIQREVCGAADAVMEMVKNAEGDFVPTLIISPPGGGKTTLLRDMIRRLSDGAGGMRPMRVCIADERGEIAASARGRPQFDVGERTDVLDGCPKAEAVMLLLRAMSPEVIAIDEITAPEDAAAIEAAANCGVKLIATAHASDVRELRSRPLYRRILESGAFGTAVTIRRCGRRREYSAEEIIC